MPMKNEQTETVVQEQEMDTKHRGSNVKEALTNELNTTGSDKSEEPVNDEMLNNIAIICQSVILDPSKTSTLKPLITSLNRDSAITLSLLKVFLHTAPLYKINIISNNIRHKKEFLKLENSDKKYLDTYSRFICKITKQHEYVNYKATTQILEKLSHFNYIEKVIVHVLEGTRNPNLLVKEMCLKVLKKSIVSDSEGYLVSKIIQQMNVFGFGPEALEILLNIPFIDSFSKEEAMNFKVQFIKEERLKKHRKLNDVKNEKKKHKIEEMSRKGKKEEKDAQKKLAKAKNECGQITFEQKSKNHQQIINAIHRVYLFVLRDKMTPYYHYTFLGLTKYRKLIKKDLFDGINQMLKEILFSNRKLKGTDRLILIKLILLINETRNVDLENIIREFLDEFEKRIPRLTNEPEVVKIIVFIVDSFFIHKKQSQKYVLKLLISMIISCCATFLPNFNKRIYNIIELYDIDIHDSDNELDSFKVLRKMGLYKN